MGYNTKNYTEQGGEKTVIGGVLEIKEGALIKGLPVASNQNNSTATTVSALKDNFNDLLAKLKDAGFMEFDTRNLSVAKAPITTEGLPITVNQSKVSAVTIADNIISVTVDVNELVEFESSTPTQGTHKWVGILITTGLTDITKIKHNRAEDKATKTSDLRLIMKTNKQIYIAGKAKPRPRRSVLLI
jgi:hypothetical protein